MIWNDLTSVHTVCNDFRTTDYGVRGSGKKKAHDMVTWTIEMIIESSSGDCYL